MGRYLIVSSVRRKRMLYNNDSKLEYGGRFQMKTNCLKYLLTILALALLLTSIVGCANNAEEPNVPRGRILTKADVLELAEKGDSLTWDDFAEFENGTGMGSGVFRVTYEIDNTYELQVVGAPSEKEGHPENVYLVNKKTMLKIDIMKDSLENILP